MITSLPSGTSTFCVLAGLRDFPLMINVVFCLLDVKIITMLASLEIFCRLGSLSDRDSPNCDSTLEKLRFSVILLPQLISTAVDSATTAQFLRHPQVQSLPKMHRHHCLPFSGLAEGSFLYCCCPSSRNSTAVPSSRKVVNVTIGRNNAGIITTLLDIK